MDIESVDLIKYATVYKSALPRETCNALMKSFYTAPSGHGYLLEESNEWEDQDGLRRRPIFEKYRKPEDLDYGILGGPIFKDFKATYPDPKSDDTAYAPMLEVLALFEKAVGDYMTRWDLNINIIQHAPLEFRYYQGPQGVGPHSDYSGHLHLHPSGEGGNQDEKEEWDWANQTFAYNLYLNDDYGEGGAVTVRSYNKQADGTYSESDYVEGSHKPEAGDIVIFPCAFPYEHWVSEIGPNVKRWMINANAIQDQPPMWQFS
jgi:hypothetical protein